ncbi:hypothetical protein [Sutcliffiella deserti]|uniref:hypothetical protein n=1 Tax=Sutcliffiella deserti TaxID=2875501 RepID=UPI001CBAE375|nr:hypothetical protein [Sutcliffiella deserti]
MIWEEECQAFSEQWVLIEAVQAYTKEKSERILSKSGKIYEMMKMVAEWEGRALQ